VLQLGATRPQNVPLIPSAGFAPIADFARVTSLLYELRNLADYDPSGNFTAGQADAAISDARQTITWFQLATKEQQETFLTLLLFGPR
jgi:hypothetical protein